MRGNGTVSEEMMTPEAGPRAIVPFGGGPPLPHRAMRCHPRRIAATPVSRLPSPVPAFSTHTTPPRSSPPSPPVAATSSGCRARYSARSATPYTHCVEVRRQPQRIARHVLPRHVERVVAVVVSLRIRRMRPPRLHDHRIDDHAGDDRAIGIGPDHRRIAPAPRPRRSRAPRRTPPPSARRAAPTPARSPRRRRAGRARSSRRD